MLKKNLKNLLQSWIDSRTKQQYINLVTMPTTSLKNFSLIESESKNGKIVKLKFKIQQDESDK